MNSHTQADGTRSADAPIGWPFGRLDPVQQYNSDKQARQLLRLEAKACAERADAARRELLDRLGEATQ